MISCDWLFVCSHRTALQSVGIVVQPKSETSWDGPSLRVSRCGGPRYPVDSGWLAGPSTKKRRREFRLRLCHTSGWVRRLVLARSRSRSTWIVSVERSFDSVMCTDIRLTRQSPDCFPVSRRRQWSLLPKSQIQVIAFNIFFRLVNRLYKHYINHNQTLLSLTFRYLSETFVRRSRSVFFLVLATVLMWRGKKGSSARPKGGTAFDESGWGQLYTEPHVQLISCRITSLHHCRGNNRKKKRTKFFFWRRSLIDIETSKVNKVWLWLI